MTLKAVKPEVVAEGKPKFLISGRSGVGKTWFSLEFPKPYYIDTEGGAVRHQYRDRLIEQGGAYFGKDQNSQDFQTVIDEIKSLATTKHEYKTLIIDSFSHLYNTAAAIAEEKIGNDFGRDKKEANRPSRQLLRWLENIDMTVILICHHRDKWERRGRDIINTGTTFDGFDKLEYVLDLWLEVIKNGNNRIIAVKKSRIESLPEEREFSCDYKIFAEIYGKEIIEKQSKPIVIASSDDVKNLEMLIKILNIPKETTEKWLEKAKVETFAEMEKSKIESCIKSLEKKLETIKGGK